MWPGLSLRSPGSAPNRGVEDSTPATQPIRIVARPILGGKTGEALPAQEILLTVAGGKKQAGASPQAANSP